MESYLVLNLKWEGYSLVWNCEMDSNPGPSEVNTYTVL